MMKRHGFAARTILLAHLAALAALAGGCAFTNRDNTPLLNTVEEKLTPKTKWKRNLAYPAIVPLGFLAVTADTLVLHPLYVIDDAAEDTADALWDDWDWDDQYVTECASLPWRAAGTPIVFSTVWIARSFFDIPDEASKAKRERVRNENREQARIDLEEAKKLLSSGRPEEALEKLKLPMNTLEDEESADTKMVWLAAARASGKWDEFHWHFIDGLKHSQQAGKVEALLHEMDVSGNSFVRFKSLEARWMSAWHTSGSSDESLALLRKALKDSDSVLRNNVLSLIDNMHRNEIPPELRIDLNRIATEDPNAINRGDAAEILRKANSR